MDDGDLDDESWGYYDGVCQACDSYGRVNDVALCQECAGKLERDLIRQRDWDYTFTGYGASPGARETRRDKVIKKYGEALELIADPDLPRRKSRKRKRKENKRKEQSHSV